MARRYRPVGAPRLLAVVAVAGAAVAGGAGAALLLHLVATPYLAVLSPLIVGAMIGAVVAPAVRRSRLHRPGVAALLATLGALTASTVRIGLEFAADRRARVAESAELRDLLAAGGADTQAVLQADHRARIAELTLRRYLARVFAVDRDVIRPDTAGPLSSLGPAGVGGALAVEVLLAALVAGMMAAGYAREPVCPRCGRWRSERALGDAAAGCGADAASHLLDGDPAAAAAALHPPDTRERLRVSLLACADGCDGEGGVLRLVEHRIDRRRRLRRRGELLLVVDAAELAPVRAALERAPATR